MPYGQGARVFGVRRIDPVVHMKDFEVLVVEGTNSSGVAMTRDILEAARRVARAPPPSYRFATGGPPSDER
jgi:hypothetical protein